MIMRPHHQIVVTTALSALLALGCEPDRFQGGGPETTTSGLMNPDSTGGSGEGPRRPPPGQPALAPPHPEDTTFHNCWVAFIHGAGRDYHEYPPLATYYWAPEGDSADLSLAWSYGLHRYVTNQQTNCKARMIGYQGLVSFDSEVPYVAQQLVDFVNDEQIPDGGLMIIAHSMGGLVSRYLMNSLEPNSPTLLEREWRPGDLDNLAVLRAKMSQVITIQTPHFGSEGADGLFGEASRRDGNALGELLIDFGLESPSEAYWSLRRSYLELRADTMGDEGRTIPIWTIGGENTEGAWSRRNSTEPEDSRDGKLHLASVLVFGTDGSKIMRNDGLVEARSAHGKSIQKEGHYLGAGTDLRYTSDRAVAGAFYNWLTTPLNHNHGRLSDIPTRLVVVGTREDREMLLGDKIRENGLALPCSDPVMAGQFPGWCP